MKITSRAVKPQDPVEEAQLAMYNLFMAMGRLSENAGFGGAERLSIEVVEGKFSISWAYGCQHVITDRGQKIENWSDLPFIPKD